MKIQHYFNKDLNIERAALGVQGFLLTNRVGGYLWQNSEPTSRYQGWFFVSPQEVGKKMYKVIERIEVKDAPPISKIRNNFWNTVVFRKNLEEQFFTPSFHNVLVYEVNRMQLIDIFLDVRESYDGNARKCLYEVFRVKRSLVVRCECENNRIKPIYIAVKIDRGSVKVQNEWTRKFYQFDKNRNSHPYERDVYKGLTIRAKKIIFAVSFDKHEALSQAESAFVKLTELKKLEKEMTRHLLSRAKFGRNKEQKLGTLCALNSLQRCLVYNKERDVEGMYAGLPWFFQFWNRDEMICLKSLSFSHQKESNEILFRSLSSIRKDGSLSEGADSVYWVLKRAYEAVKLGRIRGIKALELKRKWLSIVDSLIEFHTFLGFATHNMQKTWMDSIDRTQAPIEIQALRMAVYRMASSWGGFFNKRWYYKKLEGRLREAVRKAIWRNGAMLGDGYECKEGVADWTPRPNVFLAAYIYPHLLLPHEWVRCFEGALSKLWLPWGGISTIAKDDPRFHAVYSGESGESYHQGDSWFYLNNLTGLMLLRANAKKFKKYIETIASGSTEEILWRGIIGHHAELSDAASLNPGGSLAQSWSSALYLEFMRELD